MNEFKRLHDRMRISTAVTPGLLGLGCVYSRPILTMTDSNPLFNPIVATARGTSAMSVSALVATARGAIERALPLTWVAGEISGFKRAASGHCYFALKDEAAQVPCVLYRQKSARVPMQLRDGLAVELRVLATMYTPRGEFQLQVEEVRLSGVGSLFEAFVRLKARLESEGLFDEARKRALPRFPKVVGLITSASGAVLHDMVRTLTLRWPAIQIVLYPAVVQGDGAPASLLAALKKANARKDAQVLIIGRGGGSMEDLWAFNDEALVRAIAASALPIVSAVGHETDFTLADFAADARAPTPTYAATLVVPTAQEWRQRVDLAMNALSSHVVRSIEHRRDRLRLLQAQLKHPRERLALQQAQVVALHTRLTRTRAPLLDTVRLPALAARLRQAQFKVDDAAQYLRRNFAQLQRSAHASVLRKQAHTDALARALRHLAPERVLGRGYAYVQTQAGAVVGSVDALQLGDAIALTLADGKVLSTVEHIEKPKTHR
jgi:exodeoxyribonuclease VII large subunit